MSQAIPVLENYKLALLNNDLIGHISIIAQTMKKTFFSELNVLFDYIKSHQSQLRCIILTSECKHFCTGLDLVEASSTLNGDSEDVGRQGIFIQRLIKQWQNDLMNFFKIEIPVIVGIDNLCIGGGVDLISFCDIRVCTENAKFTIKEVDIGMCADIGSAQRLPLLIKNDGKLRELFYTGRFFDSKEALELGLISNIYKNKEEMFKKMVELATTISEKSPVAVWTIKNVLNHQQQQEFDQNLRYMQAINSSMIQTTDMKVAIMSFLQKQKPDFPKL